MIVLVLYCLGAIFISRHKLIYYCSPHCKYVNIKTMIGFIIVYLPWPRGHTVRPLLTTNTTLTLTPPPVLAWPGLQLIFWFLLGSLAAGQIIYFLCRPDPGCGWEFTWWLFYKENCIKRVRKERFKDKWWWSHILTDNMEIYYIFVIKVSGWKKILKLMES